MINAFFNRPADTTAYTSGDLVANATVAGNVKPMAFTATRISGGSGLIRRARLGKSGATTTNAVFRLHLYNSDPTAGIANGDNAAWLTAKSDYLGSIDFDLTTVNVRVFSDGLIVVGVPVTGSEISFQPFAGQTIYGLLEARGAYVPDSAESFEVNLEIVS